VLRLPEQQDIDDEHHHECNHNRNQDTLAHRVVSLRFISISRGWVRRWSCRFSTAAPIAWLACCRIGTSLKPVQVLPPSHPRPRVRAIANEHIGIVERRDDAFFDLLAGDPDKRPCGRCRQAWDRSFQPLLCFACRHRRGTPVLPMRGRAILIKSRASLGRRGGLGAYRVGNQYRRIGTTRGLFGSSGASIHARNFARSSALSKNNQ
jgi:hypothetical protein